MEKRTSDLSEMDEDSALQVKKELNIDLFGAAASPLPVSCETNCDIKPVVTLSLSPSHFHMSESNISESEQELKSIFKHKDRGGSYENDFHTPTPDFVYDDYENGPLYIDEGARDDVVQNNVNGSVQGGDLGLSPSSVLFGSGVRNLAVKLRMAKERIAQKSKMNSSLTIRTILEDSKKKRYERFDSEEDQQDLNAATPFTTYSDAANGKHLPWHSMANHIKKKKPKQVTNIDHQFPYQLKSSIFGEGQFVPGMSAFTQIKQKSANENLFDPQVLNSVVQNALKNTLRTPEKSPKVPRRNNGTPSTPGRIPRKHKCVHCAYQTDNKAHLRRHVNSVHNAYKPYKCYICEKEFTRTEKIKAHFDKWHPDVTYSVKMVKKPRSEEVEKMLDSSCTIVTEDPSNGWFEDNSPVKTANASHISLNQSPPDGVPHSNLLQGPNSTDSPIGRSIGLDDKRMLLCTQCSYIGKDRWHLKRHAAEVHGGVKEFQCQKCTYETSRKHRLISHMKQHGELICFYCSFSCSDIDEFNVHLRDCTRLNKVYDCVHCGVNLTGRKEYNRHLVNFHRAAKDLECKVCGYKTDSQSALKYHKNFHKIDKANHFTSFSCMVCQETFGDLRLLNHHAKTKHKDVLCLNETQDKIPISITNAANPNEISNSDENENTHKALLPFQCPKCPYSSEEEAIMNLHMETHVDSKLTN